MRVEESIEINRPLKEVFDYAFNVENFPEWLGPAIEVHKDTPSQLRKGDRFTVSTKFLGHRYEQPFELTSNEPNRRYTHRAAGGPIPNQVWTYTFEEVSAGTRLTRIAEGETRGFFKLAEPLIERAVERQVKNDLEMLKDILEMQEA